MVECIRSLAVLTAAAGSGRSMPYTGTEPPSVDCRRREWPVDRRCRLRVSAHGPSIPQAGWPPLATPWPAMTKLPLARRTPSRTGPPARPGLGAGEPERLGRTLAPVRAEEYLPVVRAR
jgi:hypothetical protein